MNDKISFIGINANHKGYTTLESISLLIAAIGHDLSHPGNNNMYEINTQSILACFYNNRSVLENYHSYILFSLLLKKEMNIFENLNKQDFKEVRKLIITAIISTDFTFHNRDLDKAKAMLAKITSTYETDKDMNEESLSEYIKSKIFSDVNNKHILATQLVHLADISNPTKKLKLCIKWVDLLLIEFFGQGDKEKEAELPISFNCNRHTTDIPGSQIFFLNVFVKGMINTLIIAFPGFKRILEIAEENTNYWEKVKSEKSK